MYRRDPGDLSTLGKLSTDPGLKGVPRSAHSRVDERTGELMFFACGKTAPVTHCGVPVVNAWMQGHKTRCAWHTLMGLALQPKEPRFCDVVKHDLLRGSCQTHHEGPNRW